MSGSGFTEITADNIVAFIGDILERRGADSYLGEEVTMSEHMLQCAQQAEAAGAGDEMIAAALLHDIGHYTNEFPDDALEKLWWWPAEPEWYAAARAEFRDLFLSA